MMNNFEHSSSQTESFETKRDRMSEEYKGNETITNIALGILKREDLDAIFKS